jgi:hypothetical protein
MSELEQKIEAELESMRAKLHRRGPLAKHFAQARKDDKNGGEDASTGG